MAKDDKEATVTTSVSDALRASAAVIIPDIEDGTVVRINVTVERERDNGEVYEQTYTYVGVFVNRKWYLTGQGSLLAREYQTTLDLLNGVARHNATIEVATAFDSIR